MRVTVRNEKYAKRHLYAFSQPEFFVYEGEQVKPYKWSEPGTICLTTGNQFWPVREIHPSVIVSIDDNLVAHTAPKPKVLEVAGSKGNVYTVVLEPSGHKTCSCSGFAFRRACKHLALLAD
jgi:hypothetical protein